MQLRGLLLNLKALNTPTAQIREDAKARSEYGNNYSTACFYLQNYAVPNYHSYPSSTCL